MAEFRVVLHTDRMQECAHFYGEMLGFPVAKQFPGGLIFGIGPDARIELLEVDGPAPTPNGVFVSIECDEIAGYHDRAVAAGWSISQPPTTQPWGHHNFSLMDPNGFLLIFFEVTG